MWLLGGIVLGAIGLIGGGVSFYENTDDLLKDINAEIKGWIEK